MKIFYTMILLAFCTTYAFSDDDIKEEDIKWELILYQNNSFAMQTEVLDSLDALCLINYMGCTEVIKSIDGGETWELIYTEDIDKTGGPFPDPQDSYCMQYPSKDYVYISFRQGQIRRSRDGGYTYDTLFLHTEEVPANIAMYDNLVGWCDIPQYMGEDYKYPYTDMIYYTEDGWETWDVLRPDTIFDEPIAILDIHVFGKNHFGVFSARSDCGAFFYYTKDNGQTWDRFDISHLVDDEPRVGTYNVFFLDDKNGWVGGWETNYYGGQSIDVIFKTTDGGETWELNYRQENEPIFGLQDIAFKDKMNGIATGAWGKILRTTDGGETWKQEYGRTTSMATGEPKLMDAPVLSIDYFGTKPIISTRGFGYLFWKEKYPTAVKEDERFTHSIVYPNPAQAGHLLSIDIPQGKQTARIFNLQGMLIQESNVAAKSFILYPNISAGTYFLVIEADGEIIAREKFIVE